MEKLSLRTLEVQEMEKIEAGSCGWGTAVGCGAFAVAAGLAASETPFAYWVGRLTYVGCVGVACSS